MSDRVMVGAYKPLSRWAVSPRHANIHAAVPFYTRRGAEAFFKEMRGDYPGDPAGPVLYRKRLGFRLQEIT